MTSTDDEARAIGRAALEADDKTEHVYISAISDGVDPETAMDRFMVAWVPEFIARLSAAGFVIERDWRPIAEAPKDSVMALCFSDGEVRVGAFDGSWYDPWESSDLSPTHFRPRPAPPKE